MWKVQKLTKKKKKNEYIKLPIPILRFSRIIKLL